MYEGNPQGGPAIIEIEIAIEIGKLPGVDFDHDFDFDSDSELPRFENKLALYQQIRFDLELFLLLALGAFERTADKCFFNTHVVEAAGGRIQCASPPATVRPLRSRALPAFREAWEDAIANSIPGELP
jgi:hypothetical protein